MALQEKLSVWVEQPSVFWPVVATLAILLIVLTAILIDRRRNLRQMRQLETISSEIKKAIEDRGRSEEESKEEGRREIREALERLKTSLREMSDETNREHLLQSEATAGQMRAAEDERFQELKTLYTGVNDRVSEMLSALDRIDGQMSERSEASETRLLEVQEKLAAGLEETREEQRELTTRLGTMIEERFDAAITRRLDHSVAALGGRLDEISEGLHAIRGIVGTEPQTWDGIRYLPGVNAEAELGAILAQLLAPDQYMQHATVRPGHGEEADYAVILPGASGEGSVLLPIDASLPMREYEELCLVEQKGSSEEITAARELLEAAIRLHARRVAENLIAPPYTTDTAILFLPNEGLYAETLRIPGLVDRIRRECGMTVAGPTTFAAIVSSLQMGFRSLAIGQQTERMEMLLRAVRTGMGEYALALSRTQNRLRQATQEIENAQIQGNEIRNQLAALSGLKPEEARRILHGTGMKTDDDDEWD